jgi:rhomboid family GlyGly-CTERM serine protease
MSALRSALCWIAPAAVPLGIPATRSWMLYDRAAILRGEWWRLWTGHWVHFSFAHFICDAAVLVMAGAWLERRRPGLLTPFVALSAPALSFMLLLAEPRMQYYGGLSGLATGAVVLLALTGLEHRGPARVGSIALLLATALKLGVEAIRATPVFVDLGGTVRLSASAHTAGALAALLFSGIRHLVTLRQTVLIVSHP